MIPSLQNHESNIGVDYQKTRNSLYANAKPSPTAF